MDAHRLLGASFQARTPSSRDPTAIWLPNSSAASTYSGRSSEESARSTDLKFDSFSPKTREMLIGEGHNMYGGNTPSWRATGPYQAPGRVLLPSTLIPFPLLEVEM